MPSAGWTAKPQTSGLHSKSFNKTQNHWRLRSRQPPNRGMPFKGNWPFLPIDWRRNETALPISRPYRKKAFRLLPKHWSLNNVRASDRRNSPPRLPLREIIFENRSVLSSVEFASFLGKFRRR